MNKAGVEKARVRLADAQDAFAEVQASRDFECFRAAWSKFLISCNGVVAILETSAAKCSASRQWFEAGVQDRKEDQLLSYMREARNVEEHGIEPVAEYHPEALAIGGGGEGVIRRIGFGPGRMIVETGPWRGDPPALEYVPPHARLIAVTNRRGKILEVPQYHRGEQLTDQSPAVLGELWLNYTAALLDEAEAYIR